MCLCVHVCVWFQSDSSRRVAAAAVGERYSSSAACHWRGWVGAQGGAEGEARRGRGGEGAETAWEGWVAEASECRTRQI